MERLLTPVFWSGEFHGLYSPWGHKELDTLINVKEKRQKGVNQMPSDVPSMKLVGT